MKNIALIALLALAAVSFFVGRGCADDSALEKKLEESARQVAESEVRIDSLEAVQSLVADSLRQARAATKAADAARFHWRRAATAAVDSLDNFRQHYATLAPDGLAARADSTFRAGTVDR